MGSPIEDNRIRISWSLTEGQCRFDRRPYFFFVLESPGFVVIGDILTLGKLNQSLQITIAENSGMFFLGFFIDV